MKEVGRATVLSLKLDVLLKLTRRVGHDVSWVEGRARLDYIFEWDPGKVALNARKHGVGFEQGATLFLDAEAISIPDDEHSEEEDRWVSIGLDASARLLIVIHTFEAIDDARCRIRLISARKATKKEAQQHGKARR